MDDIYLGNPNLKKANTKIEFTKEQLLEFIQCREDPLYFAENYIKIVEWPDLIAIKPKDRIDLLFKYTESLDIRWVKISGFGKWKDYKFNEI